MTQSGSVTQKRSFRWKSAALWILPLIFLSIFFFYPLASVFRLALEQPVSGELFSEMAYRVWRPLRFTLLQAGLSTLLTLVIGLPAAGVFANYDFPGKRLLRTLTTIPFILPTVVTAAAINALLGPNGWLNLGLMSLFSLESPPLQVVNSLGGILLAHVFYNTTVVLRVVGTAWARLDARIQQAARVLGASPRQMFWQTTLPLLLPSILAASLLVFLFDFTSFGVILLLGGPKFTTLEVEIYVQALQMLNLPLASLLSAVQLFFTLLLTVIYSQAARRMNVPMRPNFQREGERQPRSKGERLLVILVVIGLVVLLVLPLLALALRSVTFVDSGGNLQWSGQFYRELFINRRQSFFYVPPIEAARNSLVYAGVTVIISLLLGLLASYALSRPGWLNRILDPLLMLPLGASAVTLGLGFILVFNRPPLDVSSFPLLIPLAHSLVALPFVVRAVQPALSSLPASLHQAASVLGASPWRAWWEVEAPIAARAGLVGALFAFTISLGEFGATSMLARPEYPTLPVAIFRFLGQPGAVNYGQAMAMATILMVICSICILLTERIRLPGESIGTASGAGGEGNA